MRPILHLLWQISAGVHRLNWSVERKKSFCISLTANRPVERPKFVSTLARTSVPTQENRTSQPLFEFLNLKLHACNFTTVPDFAWVHQKEEINGREAGEVQRRGVVVATRGCGTSKKGCGFSRTPEITTDHGIIRCCHPTILTGQLTCTQSTNDSLRKITTMVSDFSHKYLFGCIILKLQVGFLFRFYWFSNHENRERRRKT